MTETTEKNFQEWFVEEIESSRKLGLRVVCAEFGVNTWSRLSEEIKTLGATYGAKASSGSDMFFGISVLLNTELAPNQIKFIREELS